MLPSYRNQSINLHSLHRLTGFYMRAILALNGLNTITILTKSTIFIDLWLGPDPTGNCMFKLTIETLEQGVQYVQSLTLNIFHTLFYCFYCYLSASKWSSGMCLQANTTLLLKIKQIYLQQKYMTTSKHEIILINSAHLKFRSVSRLY